MNISLTHAGVPYINWDRQALINASVPVAVIGAALKLEALTQITAAADIHRAQFASTSAGKLAEYRFKAEIAADAAGADADELALLDREAAARGIDRNALLALITGKAAALRQIALLIGALEAEAKAAITAIADDAADIETQIHAAMQSAKTVADTELAAAQSLLNGGA